MPASPLTNITVFSSDYAAVGAPIASRGSSPDQMNTAGAQNNQGNPYNAVEPSTAEEDPGNERSVFWTGVITKGFSLDGGNVRRYPRVGFGAIADGSSNTILYMEKSAPATNYSGQGLTQVGETYGQLGVGNFNVVRAISSPIADGETFNGNRVGGSGGSVTLQEQNVGSAHPGTCNMVLADGSTHAANNTASLASMWALQDKSDGVVFGVDEL